MKKANNKNDAFPEVKKYTSFEIGDTPRPFTKFLKENMGEDLVGVEIGLYKAENAISMLEELPIKMLYLIDPYIIYSDWSSASSRTMGELGCEEMMKNALKVLDPYKDKITFIRAPSHISLKKIPNDIDFVYIDGNHNPTYIIDDIRCYIKKVRNGGFIGGHDYHRIKVRNAVHQVLPYVYWDVGDWWYIV